MSLCLNCSNVIGSYATKFCSNQCQSVYRHESYISNWKKSQNQQNITVNISRHILKYIFEKYNGECANCGWNQINPSTNRSPLEVDHIDGNANNNVESNLILLCPNCHSLTPTYKNLNKGYGRRWRRINMLK